MPPPPHRHHHRNSLEILRHSGALARLTPLQQAVLETIVSHINSKSGTAWPSQRHIGNLIGKSRQSVCAAIGVLCRFGFISQVSRAGTSSHYRLIEVTWEQMNDIKSWVSKLNDTGVDSLDNYLSTRSDTQHRELNELKPTQNRVEKNTINAEIKYSKTSNVSISEMLLRECDVVNARKYAPHFTPHQIAAVRKFVINRGNLLNGMTRPLLIASRLKGMLESGSNHDFEPNEDTKNALVMVEAGTLRRVLEKSGLTLTHPDIHRNGVFADGILLLREPPMKEVLSRLEKLHIGKEPTAESLRQVGERQSQLSSSESLVEIQHS